jgi:hypothetical protein
MPLPGVGMNVPLPGVGMFENEGNEPRLRFTAAPGRPRAEDRAED